MGVSIGYRGSIDDVSRIPDLEDRVLDLALDLGADVRVWRSAPSNRPERCVRGLLLTLAPGQETTSLLISPEGWLINMFEITEAEEDRLTEPSWCFVKTQYGPIEAHVTLIELLTAIKRHFVSNLEVHDDSNYWESRDIRELSRSFTAVQAAIDQLANGLREFGLSPEAAEDPEILTTRIERIARLVQKTMRRPAEHVPFTFGDDFDEEGDVAREEADWDAFFKEQRRKQERLHRAIEERTLLGDDSREAFENAMRDELCVNLPEESDCTDESWDPADPWETEDSLVGDDGDEGEWNDANDDDDELRNPLVQRASDIRIQIWSLANEERSKSSGYVETLLGGIGDLCGGLVQGMGTGSWSGERGLCIVQLKRALRGAAYARGAWVPFCVESKIDEGVYADISRRIQELASDIQAELIRVRESDVDPTTENE